MFAVINACGSMRRWREDILATRTKASKSFGHENRRRCWSRIISFWNCNENDELLPFAFKKFSSTLETLEKANQQWHGGAQRDVWEGKWLICNSPERVNKSKTAESESLAVQVIDGMMQRWLAQKQFDWQQFQSQSKQKSNLWCLRHRRALLGVNLVRLLFQPIAVRRLQAFLF